MSVVKITNTNIEVTRRCVLLPVGLLFRRPVFPISHGDPNTPHVAGLDKIIMHSILGKHASSHTIVNELAFKDYSGVFHLCKVQAVGFGGGYWQLHCNN